MCKKESMAVLVLAHGSKNHAAVAEVEAIAKYYAKSQPERTVFYAYEELAEPSLESWANAYAQKYQEVIVVPLYLTLGTHLTVNLPKKMAWLRSSFPNTVFTLTGHIGADARLADIIEDRVCSVLPQL